ncbi:MAG: alpha/beta fold hydrolase [Woeseia sp.]
MLLTALRNWPDALGPAADLPVITEPLDAWLANAEERVNAESGLVDGAEKRIRWYANLPATRTEYALVYLHGFSATRQEIAPVCELLADVLQANLFETRLTGHGLVNDRLTDVAAEDWLADAAEALAVGQKIGQRTILIGTSTGATLALAMRDRFATAGVDALVLLSPNFAPVDASADILTWPGGPLLAQAVVGDERSWTAANELQERYWTTRYPLAAAVEVMRLVKAVRSDLPMHLEQPVLTLLSPQDEVVDVERARLALRKITAPANEVVNIDARGANGHVFAGDILSPVNNELVVNQILDFVDRQLGPTGL